MKPERVLLVQPLSQPVLLRRTVLPLVLHLPASSHTASEQAMSVEHYSEERAGSAARFL